MTRLTKGCNRRRSLFAGPGTLILCVFGVAGLVLFGAAANAGLMSPDEIPALGLRINAHGQGPPEDLDPPGLKIAQGKFRYEDNREKAGKWKIKWEIEADPDPFLHAVFTITNLSPAAQNFTLNSVLPISTPITGGTLTGGSFSGTLIDTGGGGAEVGTLPGASPPMYMAIIDDNDFHALMEAPKSFTTVPLGTTGFGPDDFGVPIPSLPGLENVLSNIEIEANVRLTGGDTAVLVATFVVEPIPEPSTLALLIAGGVGCLVFWWKRRVRRLG